MEPVLSALFSFQREHDDDEFEIVCKEIEELIENFDVKPRSFSTLAKKIKKFLDGCNKQRVHGINVKLVEPPPGLDRIIRVSFTVGHEDIDSVDVEFHRAPLSLPACRVVHCTYNSEDLTTGDTPSISYAKALKLIEHLSKYDVVGAQNIFDTP